MASIVKFSINLDKISKDKIFVGKKGRYYEMTLTLNDELDQFGNAGPIKEGQSKEERAAQAPNVFLGNAQVVWTNGVNVDKTPYVGVDDDGSGSASAPAPGQDDDLPF